MYLSDIQGRIREVQREADRQNTEAALGLRDELLYDIIQDDAGIYIIMYDATYLIAPVRDGDPRDFLRVFTDETLARSRASELDGARVERLTSLDFLRLAKWLFLKGVYGVVLNEGDVWTAAALHDCLRVFFERALPEEPMYSEEFVDCVLLIAAVRKNSSYGLACAVDNDSVNIDVGGEIAGYVFSEGEAMLPTESAVLFPVDLQTLCFFENPVHVTIKGHSYKLDGRYLAEVMRACGVARENDEYEPAHQFCDEPAEIDAEISDYRSIADLGLCLPQPEKGVPNDREQSSTAIAVVPQSKKKDNHGARLSAIIMRAFRPALRAGGSMAAAATETLRKLLSGPGRRRIALVSSIAAVLAAFVMISALESVRTERRFRDALSERDYAEAYRLYLKKGYGTKEDQYVADEIDALISDYLHEDITALELEACFSAIAVFPNQATKLEDAYLTSAKLTLSKDAYQHGVEAGSAIEKLREWQDVIPMDEENYKSVQRAAKENSEKWRVELLREVQDNAYTDRDTATEIAGIAACFYPDDPEVAAWCRTFQSERRRVTLGDYPIHISSIALGQDGDFDSVSIHIKWENTSVKTIDALTFLFRFYDEAGTPVSYKRRGETITVFEGVDSADGPYAPGYAVTSESWGWTGLWKGKGKFISEVKLTAVQIEYSDGSSAAYADEEELQKMQE